MWSHGDFPAYPLYYMYQLADSPPAPVKVWCLEESLTQPLFHAFLSPSRQQQEEIYRIILEAFQWAISYMDPSLIQLLDPAVNPTDSGCDFKIHFIWVLLKILLTISNTQDAKAFFMNASMVNKH